MLTPTLHISEYQSFTQGNIESCLENFYKNKNAESNQDPIDIESKAQKIFDELEKFAKQKNNDLFLQFYGSNTLKAKNYVGLIQVKGFCLEILPKTFADDKKLHKCEYHQNNKGKPPKITFKKQEFLEQKVTPFVNHITQKQDSNQNITTPNNNQQETCPICHAKQILLNCLFTLKDLPSKQSLMSSLDVARLPLLEVFILMFASEVEMLIHRGLKSDYIECAQNRAFLKGKLLFNEQIKHNLIHKERFFTQSDEYIQDIAPNRLIKSTLEFLRAQNLSAKTRTKLDSMYFVFDEISLSSDIKSDFDKCKNMRRFKEYEMILAWCAIFLGQKSFSTYSGKDKAFALLFPMEKLFESFVAHWVKKVSQDSYKVKAQEPSKYLMIDSNEKDFKKGCFSLKPDLVLRSKSEIIILDTKWKIPDSSNDEKNYGIAQSDLYQMWAYASKYAHSEKSNVNVWLIYPQCVRTNELQKQWESKKWYFKASLDSKENANNVESSADSGISLSLGFFPLA